MKRTLSNTSNSRNESPGLQFIGKIGHILAAAVFEKETLVANIQSTNLVVAVILINKKAKNFHFRQLLNLCSFLALHFLLASHFGFVFSCRAFGSFGNDFIIALTQSYSVLDYSDIDYCKDI